MNTVILKLRGWTSIKELRNILYGLQLVLFIVINLHINEAYSQTRKRTLAEKAMASNPVEAFADLIDTCNDDGSKLPKIFLCGAGANRQISVNFTNTLFVYWDKLDESSCTAVNSKCANTNSTCTWTQVDTGANFEASIAGQYKIRVVYADNSQTTFYFNVYTNPLDIPVVKNDIYCGKPGKIMVADLTGYEYSLDGITYQSSNVFSISTAGDYKVYARRLGATPTDCVFPVPVKILNKDLTVIPSETQPLSSAQFGAIKLTANDVRAQYFYKISQGTTIISQSVAVLENEYTFANLNPGSYTWSVKTDDCEWKSDDFTINFISPFQITKTVQPVTCQPGNINVSASGGKAPYQYFFNGKTTPETSNLISIPVAGSYSIRVVDSNNQTDTIIVEVPEQATPVYTIERTNENCYYPNAWQIKFNVTNANGYSLRYSIDNGVKFSTNPVFQGLSATPAGTTFKTIIEYTFGGVKCTKTEDVTIVQPQYGLSATAGISELIGCQNPPDEDKAKIRITNPQGGTPPYQYSYDGRKTWTSQSSSLQTAGEYLFYIRDINGCVSVMPKVVVENIGVPTISVINDSFNCDGTANSIVTITSATATNFSYDYSLDGGVFQSSQNFPNVEPGTHTLAVRYQPLIIPTYSNLLKEDFGYGADTTSPGMSPVYCFERQVPATQCKGSIVIQDGDYSVTSKIIAPYGAWYSPTDNTPPTSPPTPLGRFLAVNVDAPRDPRAILYEKTIKDIIPNQPIIVEFFVANLLRTTFNATAPNLTIALVDNSGTEISILNTGNVPRNQLWNKYKKNLDPGNNTSLRFIVRNNNPNGGGNDLAIDDLSAYQIPKLCTTTRTVTYIVPTGKAFEFSMISTQSISCAGINNGEIKIAAQNFNPATGYQYSIDNGTTWQTALTSPFTITNLGAGTYTLKARPDAGSIAACVKTLLPITITVPQPIVTTTTVTTLATCGRGGTIKASSTGGTPSYYYELWDELNTTNIRPVQNSEFFDNVPPGNYTIRGIDANNCGGNNNSVKITVLPPLFPNPTSNSASDLCYDALNQAQIIIDVTSGIGPFSYSLDGGTLQNSNTFSNVGPGDHVVEVTGSNNCKASTQNINIGSELKVAAVLTKGLDCTTSPDAVVTVNLVGGSRPLRYQIKKGSTIITALDIPILDTESSFTYTVPETDAGTYSFTIIDANACSKTSSVTISPKVNPKINNLTIDKPILCHGTSVAVIKVDLDTTKGIGPFTYSVKEITSFPYIVYGNQLSGLPAGKYEVTVTDSNSCTNKEIITISEPAAIDFELDSVEIQCSSGSNNPGSITVKDVIGGTTPFQYYVSNNFGELISPYPYSAVTKENHTFTLVNYGIYTVSVKDKNGCIKNENIKMSSPPTDLAIELTTSFNCINGGTAKVEVKATIGSNNYEFAVLEQNTAPYSSNYISADAGTPSIATFTGLIPGVIYSFVVHDLTTGCYFIRESNPIAASTFSLKSTINPISNIKCKGNNDGQVTFSATNFDSGATSVNYQIFKAQSNTAEGVVQNQIVTGLTSFNGTFTNLKKGLYYILFEEIGGASNGCKVASTVFEIKESLLDLDLSPSILKNANCIDKGTISVQANNGTAPYEYQIVADTTSGSTATVPSPIAPPASLDPTKWAATPTFIVDSGSYIVSVRDAYGCIKSMTIYLPKDPQPVINLTVTNGCVNEGNFEINLTKTTDGIGPYYSSVNGSLFAATTLPYTFTNQNSGDYTIVVKDVNGCTDLKQIKIFEPLGLSSKVIKHPACFLNDGEIQAIAVGGSGNFEYKIDSGSYGTSLNFSGLSTGNHTVYIKDIGTTCEKNIPVNLELPTPVTGLSLSSEPATCRGMNDGSITVTIAAPGVNVNDNPIYKYILDGGIPQDSNIFTGLTAGTYTVGVVSGRGCVASDSISVKEPLAIVVPNPTIVEFGCNSSNNLYNASITVSGVTGGSNTYTQYEFIKNGTRVQFGTSNSYIETDFSGANYTINVFDNKGCSGSANAIIKPFFILDKINVTPTIPISCISNETIKVTLATPQNNLEYSLSPISGSLVGTTFPSNPTGIFAGLAVGEYLIKALNTVTQCSIEEVYTVNEPNTFDLTINSPVVDVTCFGGSNGSVSITLIDSNSTSRAGAFSYDVKNSSGTSVQSSTTTNAGPISISGLKADIYSITATLTNNPFCSVTKKFTISQPNSTLSLSETHSDISCAVGNNDGQITALVTGGWSNSYEFKWEKDDTLLEDWGDVTTLTSLTQGNYIIAVRDAKGCSVNQPISLSIPNPISFSASSDTPILKCYADRTATISGTSVSGGQGSNYWYTLNKISPNAVVFGPQISNEFTNLGAGIYTLKVNDNWSCQTTSVTIEIKEPSNMVSTLSLKTPATCVDPAQMDLQVVGGTPPYTYSSNNVNFSSTLPNPIIGNIGVNHYFVQDANSCGVFRSNDVLVEMPNGLLVSLDKTFTKIYCTGDSTASILASAQGGFGNYTYILLDNIDVPIGLPNTTGIFLGLKAGTYKVKVTSADCAPSFSEEVIITEPVAKLNQTFSLKDALCAGSTNGAITVNSSGGTVAINYAISPNLSQFTESNLFESLGAGTYDVLVQDALGCYEKSTHQVNEPSPIGAYIIASTIAQEICFDDKNAAFSINVSGGTLPYSVSLDSKTGPFTTGTAAQKEFDFKNLRGGTHAVYIKDANNCTFLQTIFLDESVKLNPVAVINYDCVNNAQHNKVTVNLDSSITNFALVQFALDGGAYQSSNVFTNITPGNHFIRVKHINGCIKETSVFTILKIDPLTMSLKEGGLNEIIAITQGGGGNNKFTFDGEFNDSNPNYIYYKTQPYLVTVQDANGCTASVTQNFNYIDICVPNYFTPNGDGIYDTWAPGCTINYKNLTFSVFDRYGREIQTYKLGESWDGKYNGIELPTGDYWYSLKLNNLKDDREFVGHFTLYR